MTAAELATRLRVDLDHPSRLARLSCHELRALLAVAVAAEAYCRAYDTPGMGAPEVLEDAYLYNLRRALEAAGLDPYERDEAAP